jgi:hypothetical protein
MRNTSKVSIERDCKPRAEAPQDFRLPLRTLLFVVALSLPGCALSTEPNVTGDVANEDLQDAPVLRCNAAGGTRIRIGKMGSGVMVYGEGIRGTRDVTLTVDVAAPAARFPQIAVGVDGGALVGVDHRMNENTQRLVRTARHVDSCPVFRVFAASSMMSVSELSATVWLECR